MTCQRDGGAVVVDSYFLRIWWRRTSNACLTHGLLLMGRSNIYPLPDCTCGDDSMYSYVVTRGEKGKSNENDKFEKVIVTFQDGGAWFDYPSCSGKIPDTGYTNNFEGVSKGVLGYTLNLMLDCLTCMCIRIGWIKFNPGDLVKYVWGSDKYVSGLWQVRFGPCQVWNMIHDPGLRHVCFLPNIDNFEQPCTKRCSVVHVPSSYSKQHTYWRGSFKILVFKVSWRNVMFENYF